MLIGRQMHDSLSSVKAYSRTVRGCTPMVHVGL